MDKKIDNGNMLGTGTFNEVFRKGDIVEKIAKHPQTAFELAAEFHRLQLFHSVCLRANIGVTCPEPISVETDEIGRLRMTYFDGLPFEYCVRRMDKCPAYLHEITRRLAFGIILYADTVREPFYDFCPQNLLVSKDLQQVCFLDFGVPTRWQNKVSDSAKERVEISLSNFCGVTMYDTLRPSRLSQRSFRRGTNSMLSAMIASADTLLSTGLSIEKIRQHSYQVYGSLTRSGRFTRRGGYSVVKPLVWFWLRSLGRRHIKSKNLSREFTS